MAIRRGTKGDDNLSGTSGDDIFLGLGGRDTFDGGDGNDLIIAGKGTGDDLFDGGVDPDGGDIDQVVLTGDFADYDLTFDDGGRLLATRDNGVVETMTRIEGVVFDDQVVLVVGGTSGFPNLQAAVDAASDGDIILLASGDFGGNVVVDKSVTILGANAGVDGSAARDAESVLTGSLYITADGVTLDGVKLTGQDKDHGSAFYDAVGVTGNDLHVLNSVFEGSAAPGGATSAAFETGTVTGLEIESSKFSGYDVGVYVSGGGSTGSIHDNLFQGEDGTTQSGLGNGVNSETAGVTIENNTFDSLYSGSINVFPFGVTNVDLSDYVLENEFANTVPRPIQFFPDDDGIESVTGTDYNEAFNLDLGSLTHGIEANGAGGDDAIYGSNFGDELVGGTGDDRIDGNGGSDTATFAGTLAGHSLSFAGGQITVTDTDTSDGDTGADTVTNVEKLAFGDTNVLIVDASGTYGGFTTIQSAVDAASAGDTIIVRAGTYTENVTITKGLTLLGAFADTAGTDGSRNAASANGETNLIGNITTSGSALITIDGFRFQENNAGQNGYGQVHATSGDVLLTDNVFYSTVNGGASANEVRAIYVNPGSGGTATITDNYITGAFSGGFSTSSYRRGIWYDGQDGSNVVIDGNKIEYARAGINADLSGDSQLTVSDNVFHVGGTSVAVGYDVDGLTISGNSYIDTGEELNLRNIAVPITYDATDDVLALSVTSGTAYYNILGGTADDQITGTAFNDLIEGNQLYNDGSITTGITEYSDVDADTFYGMGGDDVLLGEGGDDVLDGGTGKDMMVGGSGNDRYVVDNAGDTVTESAGGGTDQVDTSLSTYRLGDNVENLVYTGTGAFTGLGNTGDNTITGGDGNDELYGFAGNDTLYGGKGSDTLTGGGGTNSLVGGEGDDFYVIYAGDTIVETANGGIDRVRGALSINLNNTKYTNVENATLLEGGAYNLTGTDGVNSLVGNSSANTITGGRGADVLAGGAGDDRFVFKTITDSGVGSGNVDRITDFMQSDMDGTQHDLIDLLAIDAKANTVGNNAFTFIGSAAFSNGGSVEGELRAFVNGVGNTVIELNTDKNHAGAEMQIVLIGAHPLTDADFVL